jgi:hypothetical protein
VTHSSQSTGEVRCVCGGSEGCMCMYDPDLNPGLKIGAVMVSGDDLHDAAVYRDNGRWTCRLCGRQALHADGSIGYGVMHTDGCYLVVAGVIQNRNRRGVVTP